MDGAKGIGLSSKFSGLGAGAASSTVGGSSALAGGASKGKLSAINSNVIKVAIVMLIVAFVYATATRFIKNKKGGVKKEEAKEAARESKDSESKK